MRAVPGRLEGKVAIVTGGGWNVGRATAIAFAREGASVVIAGRRPERLEETLRSIEAGGAQGLAITTDVTSVEETEALVAAALERFGTIDALAAIAGGGGGYEAVDAIDPTWWASVIQVNLVGTFHTVRAVLPEMRRRGAGSILTCSGGGAYFPLLGANASAYATAKAGLCRMTDQLAVELHGAGIRVNCLQPELTWDPERQAEIEAEERRTGSPHPERAMNHPPEHAAELAVWLASDESVPLTGRSISVNDDWWRDRDHVEARDPKRPRLHAASRRRRRARSAMTEPELKFGLGQVVRGRRQGRSRPDRRAAFVSSHHAASCSTTCRRISKNPIAVGDRVRVSLDGRPAGCRGGARAHELPSPHRLLPRPTRAGTSRQRRSTGGHRFGSRVHASRRIAPTGFSAACEYYEIPGRLVLNKLDLDDEGEGEAVAATYEAAGVPVLPTSAERGEGLAALADLLRGKVTAFYGASGAGKSTLLNALQPGLSLKTGKISRYWAQGKHTTTFSQMLRVEAVDGWVIDTPGIRVFRLYGINKAELRDCYPEFAPFQERCRYLNCSHYDHEPECGVFEAVDTGQLAPTRYQSYVEILDELAPPPEDDTPVEPPER